MKEICIISRSNAFRGLRICAQSTFETYELNKCIIQDLYS